MTGWVVACDAWVKITARVAACPSAPSVGEAAGELTTVPPGCGDADLLGLARLSPVAWEGLPGGLGAGVLSGGVGMGWAVALGALALAATVVVGRWRWRSRGDALALGALWGAVLVLAVPRLLQGGAGLAELQLLGSLATGVGDLALVWSILWLGGRALAEARA